MGDGRFPFEMVSGVPVVAAPEEIDITNAPALGSALLEAAAHRHGTLVVDMPLTRFCDSSGLHTLQGMPRVRAGQAPTWFRSVGPGRLGFGPRTVTCGIVRPDPARIPPFVCWKGVS